MRTTIAAALLASTVAVSAFAAEPWSLWKSTAIHDVPYAENLTEDQKLAGLAELWSEVKYNFANFAQVPELDWDAEFVAAIPRVKATTSTADYYRVLQELVAKLRDGHTYVWPAKQAQPLFFAEPPGLVTRLVEGRVIVISSGDRYGQEVVAIDGVPVRQWAEKNVAPRVFASTPQDRDYRLYTQRLFEGAEGTKLRVTFRDANGRTYHEELTRTYGAPPPPAPAADAKPKPLATFALVEGTNIGHLTLTSFNDQRIRGEFDALWNDIAKTDALIIDVRTNGGGNGSNAFYILSTLTSEPFLTSQWRTRKYLPSHRAWNRAEEWDVHPAERIEPDGKRLYTKPVIVLTGVRTFSAAEDFAGAFVTMKRGPIVGQATGGSTGQPLLLTLPGGGILGVCTKHDWLADGREFVGVGIVPDVVVTPTVDDVRARRDATLLRATEEAKRLAANRP